RERLNPKDRAETIFVSDGLPLEISDISGYSGFLTTARLEQSLQFVPSICSVQAIDHLRTGDIVAMEPANGFVRTLYRPDSNYNVIFTTNRCNSNCLMCSQPPQDRDDADASATRNLKLIAL